MTTNYLQNTLAILRSEPSPSANDGGLDDWCRRIRCAPDWGALEGIVVALEQTYKAYALSWSNFSVLITLVVEVSRKVPERGLESRSFPS
jgi:hypothetical protein